MDGRAPATTIAPRLAETPQTKIGSARSAVSALNVSAGRVDFADSGHRAKPEEAPAGADRPRHETPRALPAATRRRAARSG